MLILRRIAALIMVGTILAIVGSPAAADSADPYRAVDEYLDSYAQQNRIPGLAAAIIGPDGVEHRFLRGVDGDGAEIDTNTPFLIGSIAKSMTATIVLRLEREGRLSLADRVSEHSNLLRVADPTIEQLLTHTAGFTAADGLRVADRHDNEPGAVRRAVADLEHSGTVGEYAYTSADYLVLGAVVEAVTGRPYPEVLESELLRPLGMGDSSGTAAGAERLPAGHRQWWGRPIRYAPGADESGASYGSVMSTLTDMETYATAQLRGPGIPAEIRATMQRPWVESSSDHYGLGWSLTRLDGEPIVHHTGATPGYFSHLLLAPGQDRAIVVLANSYSEARSPALATGARDLWRIIDAQQREPAESGGPVAAMPLILAGLAVVALGLAVLTLRRPLRRRLRRVCAALALLAGLGLALLPGLLGYQLRTLWIWLPDAAVGLIAAVGLFVLAAIGWLRPVRAPDRGRGVGR